MGVERRGLAKPDGTKVAVVNSCRGAGKGGGNLYSVIVLGYLARKLSTTKSKYNPFLNG